MANTDNQPDLFAERETEPEDGCFALRRYATCDLCGTKKAPGNLHHSHGVPVLFMCDDCEKPKKAAAHGNDEVAAEVQGS